MKREKLTLDTLLTWKDFVALGDPRGEKECFIGKEILKDCCNSKEDKDKLEENFKEYIYKPFRERFKELDIDLSNFDFRFVFVKDEEGNWKLSYSVPHFLASVYFTFTLRDEMTAEKKKEFRNLLAVNKEPEKEQFLDILRVLHESYNELIRTYRDKIFEISNTLPADANYRINSDLDKFRGQKKYIRFLKENADSILEYLNGDFPIEVLGSVNKDKLLLHLLASTCSHKVIGDYFKGNYNSSDVAKHLDEQMLINILNYSNNYSLMVNYINSESYDDYRVVMRIFSNDAGGCRLPSDEVLEEYNKLNDEMKANPEYKEKIGYFDSYEELLAAKASETWRKIQNKKLIKNIKVNFEMIQKSEDAKINRTSAVPDVVNRDLVQARLKKDYDLLDEKFEYYSSKQPELNLVGINNFTGYFAQFYKNGCVVLDKFYRYGKDRKGKEKVLPAREEAIYVMNHKEFADLCKCTKLELIDEIKSNNQDVKRILHAKNWKDRVDSVINGYGYGGLDLEFVDELVKSLSIDEEPKVYTK